MKEAVFGSAVLLGVICGITAGYYATRDTERSIGSYSAPPQSVSNNVTLRGVVTSVQTEGRSITIETPSPYLPATALRLRVGLDAITRVDDTTADGTAAQKIQSSLLNKSVSLTVERQKNGTLYLRNIKVPAISL